MHPNSFILSHFQKVVLLFSLIEQGILRYLYPHSFLFFLKSNQFFFLAKGELSYASNGVKTGFPVKK